MLFGCMRDYYIPKELTIRKAVSNAINATEMKLMGIYITER